MTDFFVHKLGVVSVMSLVLAVSPIAGVAVAQDDPEVQELAVVDEENTLSEAEERALVSLGSDYGSEVDRRWDAFLEERNFREGSNPQNRFIASGVASVGMQKGNPGWIESRRIAYDVAYMRAKAALVAMMSETIQNSGEVRFTSNARFGQSQVQEHDALEQAARIREKAADFTEAALDAAIRSIDPDYDPARYEGRSMEEKQVVLEEVYQQGARRAAARAIAGAITLRIIEGPTEDGENHEILVGLLWSPRVANLAAAIGDGRTSVPVDGVRASVDQFLPQNVGEAVAAMGTRVFIDENGDHALLSFAQAEPARVNPSDRAAARRAALSVAEDLARAQIANFVGETVALESETASRQVTQVFADFIQRGVEIETEQVQSIRAATGQVEVAGINSVWRQVIEHPETEQEVAAVAVVWSPSGQAMGIQMRNTIDAVRESGATDLRDSEAGSAEAGATPGMVFESEEIPEDSY